MTFKMKNMKYWKSKNGLSGINNNSEGNTDLPDGRSGSSPFQQEDRPDPTYEGTDYYGPKGVSREKADAKRKARARAKDLTARKPKESGQKEGQYTTYGDPDFYFDNSGKKISSANVDEGELSTVKKDKNGRRYVEKSSDVGGGKLYLDKP